VLEPQEVEMFVSEEQFNKIIDTIEAAVVIILGPILVVLAALCLYRMFFLGS
jgi:hypothetical protein